MSNLVVVSGAGSGIGAAIATVLAQSQHRVALLGRKRDALEKVHAQLSGDGHHVIVADIRDPNQVRNAFAALGMDGFSGVVANAGIGGPNVYGPRDRWSEIIETNLTGTYNLVSEALPYLLRGTGYRHVVLVSSILARLGVPGYAAYCASKAGLLGLMRSWAAEWAKHGILVNALCPGWVDTAMAEDGLKDIARDTNTDLEQTRQRILDEVPLRKMSTPAEIACVVNFLLSNAQSSITGQTIDINNGALMP